MTDQDLLAVLDRLEPLLMGSLEPPNGEIIAIWHQAFQQALAKAERGPLWPEIQARARVLAEQVNYRVALVQAARDALRQELAKVGTGQRALTSYAPPTR